MKLPLCRLVLVLGVAALPVAAPASIAGAKIDGKAEFETHCSGCHPNGGNVTNPAKTLLKMDREANGVKSVKDIVKKIRKPGPGMKQYDKQELSDAKAKAIGEYIIKNFK
jgi:cytochrome c6